MNKRGFTLIEVLVVFVLIVLISSIALISYNSFFNASKNNYYKSLEGSIVMAGSDYFQDNRNKLPVTNNYSEVELNELVENNYIEIVKDSKGNNTCTGKVYVYKENGSYRYETCLVCSDYESKGNYCSNEVTAKKINITAITVLSGKTYNPNVSFANVVAVNNENVKVMFNMSDAEVSKYKITNVNTGSRYECMANSSNYCEKEIDTSGTYYVTAYDKSGRVLVNNQNMSVKIYRSGIDFSITGVTSDYDLSSTICNGNKKATVSFNIERNNNSTEFYKKIEYKVIRINPDGTKEVVYSKVITALKDSFDIGSGHYQIEVTVTNEADVPLTKKSSEFDVSYKAILKYGDVNGEEFKVVKDYPYNLPTHVSVYGIDNTEVRWYNGTTRIYPTTIVTEDCIHTITGDVSVTPTVTLVAKTATYSGSAITANTATVDPSSGGTLSYVYYKNNTCSTKTGTASADGGASASGGAPKESGTWYVKATVSANKIYTTASSSCVTHTISKAVPTVTLTAKTATYSGSAITANTASVSPNSGGSISYVYYKNNTCSTKTGTAAADGGASASGGAPKESGTWYVKATVAAKGNYDTASSSCVTHTISKAVPTVTLKAKTATYTGKAISANTATVDPNSGGTISYVYYKNNKCTTKTGTASADGGAASSGGAPKSVGTWYVKATVAANGNYDTASSTCVKHTINSPPATAAPTTAPSTSCSWSCDARWSSTPVSCSSLPATCSQAGQTFIADGACGCQSETACVKSDGTFNCKMTNCTAKRYSYRYCECKCS